MKKGRKREREKGREGGREGERKKGKKERRREENYSPIPPAKTARESGLRALVIRIEMPESTFPQQADP